MRKFRGFGVRGQPEGSATSVATAVHSFYDSYGVSSQVQDELLADLADGGVWDALAGGTPVSIDDVVTAGQPETVSHYADGSIKVTGVEVAQERDAGQAAVRGVDGCTRVNSTNKRTFTNCRVHDGYGLLNMAFMANYWETFAPKDAAYVTGSSITSATNAEVTVIGGTANGTHLERTRVTGSASGPATARLTSTIRLVSGSAQSTAWLQLNVPIKTYTLAFSTTN